MSRLCGIHLWHSGGILRHHPLKRIEASLAPQRSGSYCDEREQKNHTHVRQFLGYERLEHRELLGDLNDLLKLWSQWRNLFCVTMKQESKRREGSRQIRRHEKQGRSPARRLIDSGELRAEECRKLEKQLETLDPFAMRKEIRRLEDQLWSRREKLLQAEEREALVLADDPALRCGSSARTSKPTKNQAARVS